MGRAPIKGFPSAYRLSIKGWQAWVVESPGPLIGRGRHADVFDIGDGLVLRRYRYERDTTAQALAMQAAANAGFPVPAVVSSGGRDLVMARVEGPTMLADLARRPWLVRRHALVLAGLHHQLHAIEAPPGLEQPVGAGSRLLHLDLQPENVLLTPNRGPVVLDWEWAAVGPPAADVAHTWLQVATSEVPGGRWRRLVGSMAGRAFLRAFFSQLNRAEAAACMPVVREYRLARRELTPRERRAVADFAVGEH
jgi:aminoglycoside phosphotransferase (APT) family kinase protein